MKIRYQDKSFSYESLAIIREANKICTEYATEGYILTLRQLYYQFVARGYLKNTEANYKRLGNLVNDGRLSGLIDWEHMEDRTRNLRARPHWKSPVDIISTCAKAFHIDLWAGQTARVEVWVEKEALAGIIEQAAKTWDTAWFCCRGFVSQSEMHAAALRLRCYEQNNISTHILYLGDHDPSGIAMSKDIQSRLKLFGANTEVHRIALNMDQIEELNPPPNPAKTTDSRFKTYLERFGNESWELDALPPETIISLIEDKIKKFVDNDLMDKRTKKKQEGLNLLQKVVDRWDSIAEHCNDEAN